MVHNGDGHLKNFGVLDGRPNDLRIAPMFDVTNTATCKHQRFEGALERQEHAMALKLFTDAKWLKKIRLRQRRAGLYAVQLRRV